MMLSDPYFVTESNGLTNTCSSIKTSGWHITCYYCVSTVSTLTSVSKPVALLLSADGGSLFVQNNGGSKINIIDAITGSIRSSFTCN